MKTRKIVAILLAVVMVFAFAIPAMAAPQAATSGIVWNGASDKAVAATIGYTPSTRTTANGDKIASNAQSADFPGIYFIWDSKQADNGYLKVAASIFDTWGSFTLTTKESNTYTDFVIALQAGQVLTADGCYVFYIPKVVGDKNINMVFIGGWTAKAAPDTVVNLGFIGYYLFNGDVLSTSIYWQKLEPGDKIDWDAVDAAYADWVAGGGLAPDRSTWQTSGYASFTFKNYAPLGYDDFNIGQLENYYKAYYVDPGYVMPAQSKTYNIGFDGFYGNNPNTDLPMQTSFYWQSVTADSPIDWDAVYTAYEGWAAKGGDALFDSDLGTLIGWKVSGTNQTYYYDNGTPPTISFDSTMLEHYYNQIYLMPIYA